MVAGELARQAEASSVSGHKLEVGGLAYIRGLGNPAANGLIVTLLRFGGDTMGTTLQGRLGIWRQVWWVRSKIPLHGYTEFGVGARFLVPIGPPGLGAEKRKEAAA